MCVSGGDISALEIPHFLGIPLDKISKLLLSLNTEYMASSRSNSACMAFEDFLRGLYYPNPPSEMENSLKDD